MSNKIVVPYAKYAYCYDHTLIFPKPPSLVGECSQKASCSNSY
ncbi:hypothetical protein [Candidatus Culexarchaeum yellowstonense]|nr:hypothetical protein [Candidatus Culexarchaeum yellowstonense]